MEFNVIQQKIIKISNLITKRLNKQYNVKEVLPNYFAFIYKDKKGRYLEILDMSNYVDEIDEINEIDISKVIPKYKSLLNRFNNTLRSGETERTFLECYTVGIELVLNKIDKVEYEEN